VPEKVGKGVERWRKWDPWRQQEREGEKSMTLLDLICDHFLCTLGVLKWC
jgi:hypothetical protein